MNYAKYSSRRKDFVFKAVFENSFDTIVALLEGHGRVRHPPHVEQRIQGRWRCPESKHSLL